MYLCNVVLRQSSTSVFRLFFRKYLNKVPREIDWPIFKIILSLNMIVICIRVSNILFFEENNSSFHKLKTNTTKYSKPMSQFSLNSGFT
jgi:hypothetical protein